MSKDDKKPPKPEIIKKIEKLARNDVRWGRGNPKNPNNQPNGK
jgi:hypothetical protein